MKDQNYLVANIKDQKYIFPLKVVIAWLYRINFRNKDESKL